MGYTPAAGSGDRPTAAVGTDPAGPVAGWGLRSLSRRLGLTAVLNGASYALVAATLVATGRVWGPVEFGSVALSVGLAGVLFLPMTAGLHGALYRLLPVASTRDQPVLIGSAAAAAGCTIVGFAGLYLAVGSLAGSLSAVPASVWNAAVLLAATSASLAVSESFLRGRFQYRRIGGLRLGCAIIFAASMGAILRLSEIESVVAYQAVYAAAFGLFPVAVWWSVRRLRPTASLAAARRLLADGRVIVAGMLWTSVFLASDLVAAASTLSEDNLGVYAAYQALIRQVVVLGLWEILGVVLLPAMATADRARLFGQLRRWGVLLLLGTAVIAAGAVSILVLIFGSAYPYRPSYVVVVAVGVAAFALSQVVYALLTFDGDAGAQVGLRSLLLATPLVLGAVVAGAASASVGGMMIGASVGSAVVLVALLVAGHRFFVATGRAA